MSLEARDDMVVHFGMHKTGTSSIQESLFRRLADKRFYYVNFGIPNASNGVTMCFRTDLERYGPLRKTGVTAAKLASRRAEAERRLSSEIEESAGRTAVISGEHIGKLSDAELRDMRRFLAERGRHALLPIAYVRRPKEYMESAFQQRVRGGLGRLNAERLFPEYRQRFAKFDTVFGRENVRLSVFEPGRFPGGCVVRDFCARVGIEFRAEEVIRVNEALSLPALSLLFAYHRFGPGFGVGPRVLQENRLLVERLRALPGPKPRLHSALVAPVIERRRDEIEWMEARLEASLGEELAAHDEGAVRSESDLLKFSAESLHWLAQQLGPEHVRRCDPAMSPEAVAAWVHLLRLRLSGRDGEADAAASHPAAAGGPSRSEDKVLTAENLASRALRSDECRGIPREKASALLRQVFGEIADVVGKAPDRKIAVEGLGQFRIVSKKEKASSGKPGARKAVFRPAEPGPLRK
jgi:hypothetical protein